MVDVELGLTVRVHLMHALLQFIADEAGIDLLHIKGPALESALRASRPTSTDADVLVRPRDAELFLAQLRRHGFDQRTTFESGSAFEHAASLWHDTLGWVDAHRRFPGIGLPASQAFDVLWRDRSTIQIAHVHCSVPPPAAQRLILMLHAARGDNAGDRQRAWTPEFQPAIENLAVRLDAEVALAAATGHLDEFRDHPEYRLWAHFASGDHRRLDEWRGRIQAARNPAEAARLLLRALLVNHDHLAMRLGRQPTTKDLALAYVGRARTAAREVRHALKGRQ